MITDRYDVFVSGGGIAGLVAAAAFGAAGFSVCLADPAPPASGTDDPTADLRSTAYLRPARALMARAGIWEVLAPHAMPLEVLQVIDSTGWPPVERDRRAFRAEDLGDEPFGWNLLNWLTRRTLTEALGGLDGVELRFGTGFRSLLQRDREAIVTLTDGTRLAAKLVIGADGRASPVREAAGIGAQVTRYGQTALAFSVTHPHPHENVSTEIYNEGGAFTLVPLPDQKGGPASAVVWMNAGARAAELLALPDAAFEEEMTLRALGLLGRLELASPKNAWPIVTQRADRLWAPRVAIVAEAAHVMPPIGAQGLNTSLADVRTLLDLAEATPGDLGSDAMLAAYERARAPDIRARAAAIDLFNRVCRSGEAPVQALRLAGLRTVHDIAPLRQAVMRAGLGRGA